MSVAAALESGRITAEDLKPVLRNRCRLLERRVRRARRVGWDINAVAQLREELTPLVQGLHALGESAAVDTVLLLAEALAHPLEQQALPDPVVGARVNALIETLIEQLPTTVEADTSVTTPTLRNACLPLVWSRKIFPSFWKSPPPAN